MFMISPIGLAIGAVIGLIGAFAYLSGFASDVLGHLGDLWGNLKSTAMEAWGGIVDAVGAGDLALAGEIGWAGLKLGFAEVVGFLKGLWSSFKNDAIQLAFDAAYKIEAVWEEMSNGIGNAWANAMKFMGDLWQNFKGLVHSGWESTMNWLEDKWLDGIAKVQGLDRGALQKQADGDRAKRYKDYNDNDKSDSGARQNAFNADQAKRAADRCRDGPNRRGREQQ